MAKSHHERARGVAAEHEAGQLEHEMDQMEHERE